MSEYNPSNYVIGRRAVFEAIEAGAKLQKVMIAYGTEEPVAAKLRAVTSSQGVACALMDRRKFAILEEELGCEKNAAQGVIAIRIQHTNVQLDELLETAKRGSEFPIVLVLDGITDPHNLGAIARSAECVGAAGLILPTKYSAPITSAAVKASAGALEHLPVANITRVSNTLRECKAAGWSVIGTASPGTNVYDFEVPKAPLLIVIGSEGEGLHEVVLAECDAVVEIPMMGKISSLNASVAAGIILFEIRRKQAQK
ncbi:MAG: 23S rRNA (guanosine(2251)-2'-O)-methyltransferase RlmB [Ignavibacteria bacterium]|nr:23S rRNA (guanosine(2251)-2'-O)-methyltransferase RlmB [Ignavibacteria bacterium]